MSLTKLGFLEDEIKILTCLFIEKKIPRKELAKKLNLPRDTIEFCLNMLEQKDLIKYNNEICETCSEAEFIKWIHQAKKASEKKYDLAENCLHSFFTQIKEASWKPEIQYFEGREGIIEIYEDMLNSEPQEIRSWIDIQKIHDFLGKDYLMKFINTRIERKIKVKAIMQKNKMNLEHETRDENRIAKLTESLPLNGEIRIYKNKVAIITFDGDTPIGFLFEGKIIATLFTTIFEEAFNNL